MERIPMSLPTIETKVSASNSCNRWFCCFGSKCCTKSEEEGDTPKSGEKISVTTTKTVTEEKTTKVYKVRHWHRKKNELSESR